MNQHTKTLHRARTEDATPSLTNKLFFEFLTLKVSLSVLGRAPESRRSVYVQHGCAQKLSGPEAQASYRHNTPSLPDQSDSLPDQQTVNSCSPFWGCHPFRMLLPVSKRTKTNRTPPDYFCTGSQR